jgi:hypothetical protein
MTGQEEKKESASVRSADFDVASMSLYDALHEGEPEAETGTLPWIESSTARGECCEVSTPE